MSFIGVLSAEAGQCFAESLAAVLLSVKHGLIKPRPHKADTFAVAVSEDTVAADVCNGRYIVVFRGRVYERDDAIALLCIPSTSSDAELLVAAYERWGDIFPEKLYGEFAFALFDRQRRRLLLGKDAMGAAPLFYGWAGSDLYFASEPYSLNTIQGIDTAFDEKQIALWMMLRPTSGRTLFRGISSLSGGHVLAVEQGATQLLPYTGWAGQNQLLLKDHREYTELIRSALVRAVRNRLPAGRLIGSHLSSGFDSSGITALAAKELALQGRSLVAYTAVPSHAVPEGTLAKQRFADEWPLASKVAAMYDNVEHVAIPNDGWDWWEAIDGISDAWMYPPFFLCNLRWYFAIGKDAQARGLNAMMLGARGNLTSSYGGGFGLYDLRMHGRWLSLWRAMRNRRTHGEGWKSMAMSTILPSANSVARIRKLMRKPALDFFDMCLMRREFYESTDLPKLGASIFNGGVVETDRRSGAAWRLSMLKTGETSVLELGDWLNFGVHAEDPTFDSKLVELCLSIPDEVFCPGGKQRDLYRMAFAQDLPNELLNERRRGQQSSDFLEMFAAYLPKFRDELELLEASSTVGGYIDLPRLRKALDDYPKTVAQNRMAAWSFYNHAVGGALLMGRFLRRIEAQRASSQFAN